MNIKSETLENKAAAKLPSRKPSRKRFKADSQKLVLAGMASLSLVFLAVFAYMPMFGVVLAFKDADRKLNIISAMNDSPFVGFKNFKMFLLDSSFISVLLNTVCLNLLMLFVNFPLPILFALFICELRMAKAKTVIQALVIFPHFLSWAIFGGIMLALTDMSTGIVTPVFEALGIASDENPVNLGLSQYFWAEMIIYSAIKSVGWGSIIYVSAIVTIDTSLYEAADLDGAGRLRKMFRITLPLIMPTVTVFLLLNISGLLGNSYEQFIVFQNDLNLERSEVLATYTYKMGLSRRRYSYASAMSLFESAISLVLLILSNAVSKRVSGKGIY